MGRKSAAKLKLSRSTGIPGIDIQHNELFAMLNSLLDILEKPDASTDSVIVSVEELVGAMKSHYSTEENLFLMINFPRIEEHKALHRKLLAQLRKVLKTLPKNGISGASVLLRVFCDDLIDHFAVYDREYSDHIEKLLSLRKKFNISALKARALVE